MSKIKCILALCAIASLPLFGQFMDPERPSPKQSPSYRPSDDLFPWIIPWHDWGKGGGASEQVVSNLCVEVASIKTNLNGTVKNDANMMTNSAEFVKAVVAIAPGGAVPTVVEELKTQNAKFKAAFANIASMPISQETTIDEIKSNFQIIKAAAQAVLND